MATVELEIPSRTAYVVVARLVLSSLARAAELEEGAVDDLKIAVSEACANAVLSHEQSGTDAPVSIAWDEDPGRIVVQVGDRGPAYEPSRPDDSLHGSARFDMSIALMKSLVDECTFGPRDDGGMCTRLVMTR